MLWYVKCITNKGLPYSGGSYLHILWYSIREKNRKTRICMCICIFIYTYIPMYLELTWYCKSTLLININQLRDTVLLLFEICSEHFRQRTRSEVGRQRHCHARAESRLLFLLVQEQPVFPNIPCGSLRVWRWVLARAVWVDVMSAISGLAPQPPPCSLFSQGRLDAEGPQEAAEPRPGRSLAPGPVDLIGLWH